MPITKRRLDEMVILSKAQARRIVMAQEKFFQGDRHPDNMPPQMARTPEPPPQAQEQQMMTPGGQDGRLGT